MGIDGFLSVLLFLGIWIAIFSVFSSVLAKARKQERTISSDGHVVSKEEDLTCEGRDGHVHPKLSAKDAADFGRRYIVHNDPETGYVILNGVKRKLSDCKDL